MTRFRAAEYIHVTPRLEQRYTYYPVSNLRKYVFVYKKRVTCNRNKHGDIFVCTKTYTYMYTYEHVFKCIYTYVYS